MTCSTGRSARVVRMWICRVLIRQALTGSGETEPRDGPLTMRLDPLPTQRATTAIAELCEHLTATHTRYPGTNIILRYEVKTHP
jgi:hypothetical protein